MTGMGGPPGPGNASIIAEFHHALATQGALVLLLGVVLFVAWNQLRSMQYRRAVARGTSTSHVTAPGAPEPAARRFLRVAFGVLWIVDGLLQLQAGMPTGLVDGVIKPAAATSPGWVQHLVDSGVTVWANHPAAAAASTVWIQLGIGLLLLVGPRGWWSRGAGLATVGWGLVVWSVGNAFGGIFAPGLTILFGAPGAVLFYVVAGALVALPDRAWEGPQLGRLVLRAAGVLLLGAAVLQAWPGRGFWQGTVHEAPGTLAAMVGQMAQASQPGPLHSLVSSFASFDRAHGWGVNLVAVVALAGLGTALLVGARTGRRVLRPTMVVFAVLCVADWILIEDFGFWGGVGTDPNSMLPLLFVVFGGYLAVTVPAEGAAAVGSEVVGTVGTVPLEAPVPVGSGVAASSDPGDGDGSGPTGVVGGPAPGRRSWWEGLDAGHAGRLAAAIGALGILLVGVVPMTAAAANRTADPQIAEAVDGAPDVASGPAPPFTLTDVQGRPVSLADLRGSTVVLTFLDPVCTTDCPIIAQELKATNGLLGADAAHVRFVAVVANPVYRSASYMAAFDRQEGLDTQANWTYLTGSLADLQSVWNTYGVSVVTAPAGGMVVHADIVYVIDAHGTLRRIINADTGSGTSSVRSSFSGLLASQVTQVQSEASRS
jgi:cytochrome oxidase Cu insertion factor (SCO1/SenC/PrrC family)